MRRIVSNVTIADRGSEETVIARPSITISLRLIPYFSASAIIFFAIAILPSASAGIPLSSSGSATITPPYLAASGKTISMLSCLPLTELIIAFPLYRRKARSIAAASVVSICSGSAVTLCSLVTTEAIISGSSISGSPTLTSSTSAPASSCCNPCPMI